MNPAFFLAGVSCLLALASTALLVFQVNRAQDMADRLLFLELTTTHQQTACSVEL